MILLFDRINLKEKEKKEKKEMKLIKNKKR